jgi:hypothetical protein
MIRELFPCGAILGCGARENLITARLLRTVVNIAPP